MKTENQKTFTSEQVQKLIKIAVVQSTEATFDWLKNETIVVDKKTRKELKNVELELCENPKSLSHDYVWKRLRKKGINFINQ